MLFNSIDFAIFFPIVFILYWFVFNRNLKLQNLFILAASYVFYGWWSWIFLTLIFYSTVIDYSVGLALEDENNPTKRNILLSTSLFFNLGFLCIFKYYNFFVDNFVSAISSLGYSFNTGTLDIIIPVGISFYTFQTMSYTIDIYRRRFKPTKDFIAFSAYVSFFPQLVAGPIERAHNLLPQFFKKRNFDYNNSVNGLKQILWGLFKKIVIADNCAVYVNMIFSKSDAYKGSTLLFGAFFFAFQIYGDFSGYSDIAIGTSKLFGFRLMQNFAYPYFSRDIAEFWRRWHISLSTWFRDYVYIPLGGSRGNLLFIVRNVFIIFLVSGFWHGANWTFIVWGALNAIYFLPVLILGKNRKNIEIVAKGKKLPGIFDFINILNTFILVTFAWIIFRSSSIYDGMIYIRNIFTMDLFSMPNFPKPLLFMILAFILTEWIGREQNCAIEKIGKRWRRLYRWAFYDMLILFIILFAGRQQDFIYFQF